MKKYILLFSILPVLCACESTGKLAGNVLMLPVRIFKSTDVAPPPADHDKEIKTVKRSGADTL